MTAMVLAIVQRRLRLRAHDLTARARASAPKRALLDNRSARSDNHRRRGAREHGLVRTRSRPEWSPMSYLDVYDHAAIDEDERLNTLGEAINEGTFRRLRLLDVRPDWRCLEIGAGTGGIARTLAKLCPDGEIIATDLDTRNLGAISKAGVRVLRHDVTTDAFPDGSFDLIVARWVFMHLPRRGETLRRVVRWLKPGGCLLIEDGADFAMRSSPNPLFRKVTEAVKGTLSEIAGTDTDWARTFPKPLARVGLERLAIDVDVPLTAHRTAMTEFLVASVLRIAEPLVASGRLTEAELADWHTMITSDQFWDLGLANVAAWGYRPGQH
jgi:SAM-dependent methyltransferase